MSLVVSRLWQDVHWEVATGLSGVVREVRAGRGCGRLCEAMGSPQGPATVVLLTEPRLPWSLFSIPDTSSNSQKRSSGLPRVELC